MRFRPGSGILQPRSWPSRVPGCPGIVVWRRGKRHATAASRSRTTCTRISSAAPRVDEMRCLRAAVLLLAAIAFGPAAAQTRSPADDTLESALVHWRAASWYSRLGNDDVTAIEIDSFRTAWQAVAALPIGGRPSLYAKDPQWRAAAGASSKQADAATAAAGRNHRAGTPPTFAQIRDLLAQARP